MEFQSKDEIEGNDYPETGESRTLLTISGDSARVEGKFTISKSIEIDCEISGELEVDGELIIQKNGYVNADVKTINAQVIGKYDGNMEATKDVEIKETGEVSGKIKTDSLIINKGGIFSGNVTRISSDQPEPEPEPEPEPVDQDQEIDLEEPESDSEDLEL